MKSQSLLSPLLEWSTEVFRLGREQGLPTKEIVKSVKTFSKERGWANSQINKILRYNGVLKPRRVPHPVNIICPKCNGVGRLNSFHNASGHLHYVVIHGPMRGTWGKVLLKKRRRCYFYNLPSKPKYYENIVKQIQASLSVKHPHSLPF